MKKNKTIDVNHISPRTVNTEGIDFLWWVTLDTKAFNGPLEDWIKDRDNFLKYVKNRNLVVQAGGNCGMYARFYGNYFKNIFTFEPQENNFSCLDLNCQGDQYHKFNVGLGSSITKADISHISKTNKRTNMGAWKITENPDGPINLITIDSLDLPTCDLIHLDIEGYESFALQGAEKTIKKFNPVIILEEGHGSEIAESFGYSLKEKLTSDWIYLNEKF